MVIKSIDFPSAAHTNILLLDTITIHSALPPELPPDTPFFATVGFYSFSLPLFSLSLPFIIPLAPTEYSLFSLSFPLIPIFYFPGPLPLFPFLITQH